MLGREDFSSFSLFFALLSFFFSLIANISSPPDVLLLLLDFFFRASFASNELDPPDALPTDDAPFPNFFLFCSSLIALGVLEPGCYSFALV